MATSSPAYWSYIYYGCIALTLYSLLTSALKPTKHRGVHAMCLILMSIGLLYGSYLSYYATHILTSALSKLPPIQESSVLRDIALSNTVILVTSMLSIILQKLVIDDIAKSSEKQE